MEDTDIARELADVAARSKSNSHRLDKLEENVEAVQSLATSVAVMAQKQGQMASQMEKVAADVEEMKLAPGKKWTGVVEKALYALVAALMGFVLAKLGLA